MATNTPNLNLRKPATGDFVDVVNDLDDNYDIIDDLLPKNKRIFKRKLVDQVLNNSEALQDDNNLFFAAVLGRVYFFRILLLVTGGSSSTANIKIGFTFPTGVLSYGGLGPAASLAAGQTSAEAQTKGVSEDAVSPSDFTGYGAENAGTVTTIILEGTYECTVSGTVHLQWAQNNHEDANLQVMAGSHLVVDEIY